MRWAGNLLAALRDRSTAAGSRSISIKPLLVLLLALKLVRPNLPLVTIMHLVQTRLQGLLGLKNLINIPQVEKLVVLSAQAEKMRRCCLQTRLVEVLVQLPVEASLCSRWGPQRSWLSRLPNSHGWRHPNNQVVVFSHSSKSRTIIAPSPKESQLVVDRPPLQRLCL